MTREGKRLEEEVMQALHRDLRVDDREIGVVVKDGVVTLHGTASSYAEKLAAEEAAHRVPAACDVADEIAVEVSGLRPTDAEIARAVRRALRASETVPDDRIASTVAGGWVTLTGAVDDPLHPGETERAVQWLDGVRGVVNKILLAGPPHPRRRRGRRQPRGTRTLHLVPAPRRSPGG